MAELADALGLRPSPLRVRVPRPARIVLVRAQCIENNDCAHTSTITSVVVRPQHRHADEQPHQHLADVVELADTSGSDPGVGNSVRVQVPPSARSTGSEFRAVWLTILSQLAPLREPLPHHSNKSPSSSGLGHHPFKVKARVQIPLGVRRGLRAAREGHEQFCTP